MISEGHRAVMAQAGDGGFCLLPDLVKMRVSWGAHALSTLPGTPSGPAAFAARNSGLTSCSVTVRMRMGAVFSPLVGRAERI